MRLDLWLQKLLSKELRSNKLRSNELFSNEALLESALSRTTVQRLIRQGCVTRPGSQSIPLSNRYKVESGQEYRVILPPARQDSLSPVAMEFSILHEDDQLAVIHKPPGIAVHPGSGDNNLTLAHGLIHRWPGLPGSRLRPGIVHRLDRDTEGILLIGKEEASYRLLMEQFAQRQVEKNYLAWLIAAPRQQQGRIELPMARHPLNRLKMQVSAGGRLAITDYSVNKTVCSRHGRKFCQVGLHPLTGRTHQLRAQMAHLGCPVVGDVLYSRNAKQFSRFGLLLLACHISFKHPASGERLEFQLDIPERFQLFEQLSANF